MLDSGSNPFPYDVEETVDIRRKALETESFIDVQPRDIASAFIEKMRRYPLSLI